MKNVFMVLALALGACSLLEKKEEKPGKELGVFHPAPWKYIGTDGKEHTCNLSKDGKGGYCEDDKKCHSSAEKCLKR